MRDVIDIMSLLKFHEKGTRPGTGRSIYVVDFEPVFLRKSQDFYQEEAESSLQTFDASTYLRLVSCHVCRIMDVTNAEPFFRYYRSKDESLKSIRGAQPI